MAPEVIGQTEFTWDDESGGGHRNDKKDNNKPHHKHAASTSKNNSKHSKSSKTSKSGHMQEIDEELDDFLINDNSTGGLKLDTSNNNNSSIGPSTPSPTSLRSQTFHHDAYLDAQNHKADIWSLGILALELAYGSPPHANADPKTMRKLVLTEPAPTAALYRDSSYTFSEAFHQFVSSCLIKESSKRSSSASLLNHKFFKKAKKYKYVQEKLINDLIKKRTAKMAKEERERKQAELNQRKKKV